jgi:hypothetical protein
MFGAGVAWMMRSVAAAFAKASVVFLWGIGRPSADTAHGNLDGVRFFDICVQYDEQQSITHRAAHAQQMAAGTNLMLKEEPRSLLAACICSAISTMAVTSQPMLNAC